MGAFKNDEGLTAQQMNAAAMLANGLSQEKTAKALGIRKQTLVEWGRIEVFKEKVNELMEDSASQLIELANEARLGMLNALPQVQHTLMESLEAVTPKGQPDWWARHKAAEMIIKAAGLMVPATRAGAAGADGGKAELTANVAVVVVNSEDARRAMEIKTEAESVIDVEAIEKEQDFQQSLSTGDEEDDSSE